MLSIALSSFMLRPTVAIAYWASTSDNCFLSKVEQHLFCQVFYSNLKIYIEVVGLLTASSTVNFNAKSIPMQLYFHNDCSIHPPPHPPLIIFPPSKPIPLSSPWTHSCILGRPFPSFTGITIHLRQPL